MSRRLHGIFRARPGSTRFGAAELLPAYRAWRGAKWQMLLRARPTLRKSRSASSPSGSTITQPIIGRPVRSKGARRAWRATARTARVRREQSGILSTTRDTDCHAAESRRRQTSASRQALARAQIKGRTRCARESLYGTIRLPSSAADGRQKMNLAARLHGCQQARGHRAVNRHRQTGCDRFRRLPPARADRDISRRDRKDLTKVAAAGFGAFRPACQVAHLRRKENSGHERQR